MCLRPDEIDVLMSGEVDINDYDVVTTTPKTLKLISTLGPILKAKMPHERKGM